MFAYSLQFNQMSVKFIISQSFQIGVKQSYSDYLKKQIDLSEKRHLSFHIKYIKITHPPTDIFEIWYFILLIWSLTHYKEFHLCSVYGWYFSIFIEQCIVGRHKKPLIRSTEILDESQKHYLHLLTLVFREFHSFHYLCIS